MTSTANAFGHLKVIPRHPLSIAESIYHPRLLSLSGYLSDSSSSDEEEKAKEPDSKGSSSNASDASDITLPSKWNKMPKEKKIRKAKW